MDEAPSTADDPDRGDGRLERLLWAMEQLHAVSANLRSDAALDDVLETVLRSLRRVVQYGRASVLLLEDGRLRVVASDPPVSAERGVRRQPLRTGLAGQVVRTLAPVTSSDVRDDPRADTAWRRRVGDDATRSYVGVPLVAQGDLLGVLQVEHVRPRWFDGDDVTICKGMAAQVAPALAHSRRTDQVARVELLKSDFLDRVAHELQTPVTVVTGFARTLLEHDEHLLPEQRVLFLERLVGAAERLATMVDQALALTSLEAGVQAPALRICDVGDVIRRTVAENGGAALFTVSLEPDLVTVTDPQVVALALRALLTNARAYAGGGTVRAWRAADRALVVDVVDEGPGIPEGAVHTIHQRFGRGDTHVPGLGLGLPMARHLLSLVGGTLEHRSRDTGTAFRLRLPWSDATIGRREGSPGVS